MIIDMGRIFNLIQLIQCKLITKSKFGKNIFYWYTFTVSYII